MRSSLVHYAIVGTDAAQGDRPQTGLSTFWTINKMIMQNGGVVSVTLMKANYSLPLYAILNSTGYEWMTQGFTAKINPNARYTAGVMTSYASIEVKPDTYIETILNPNVTTGTVVRPEGVADWEINDVPWAVYAPHNLNVVYTTGNIGPYTAEDKPVYVPPGDESVLYPEVNLKTRPFDYSDFPQKFGYAQSARLWCGSSLYHPNDMNVMLYNGIGGWEFYSGFHVTSVASFSTETQGMYFNAFNGLVRMIQVRNFATHGISRLWKFAPGTYDPSIGCPLPLSVSDIVFGVPSLDAAFAASANVHVHVWKNGFIIRIHTGGTGPTGQEYEFAITDADCTRFYLLKFIYGDTATKTAMTVGTPSIKIDQNGNIFWTNQNIANRQDVFFAGEAVMFDWPKIQTANIPPLTLPCFNPCLSI